MLREGCAVARVGSTVVWLSMGGAVVVVVSSPIMGRSVITVISSPSTGAGGSDVGLLEANEGSFVGL